MYMYIDLQIVKKKILLLSISYFSGLATKSKIWYNQRILYFISGITDACLASLKSTIQLVQYSFIFNTFFTWLKIKNRFELSS